MTRRRTTVLLAVAAMTLSACGVGSSSSGSPDVGPVGAEAESSLELVIDGSAVSAKCMVPNAESLSTQDTAFAGTVETLGDGTATLSVVDWYAGDPRPDTVTVATPAQDLQQLLLAVDFVVGSTYLVSSLDGRVSLCGFTAERSPELQALYEQAFAD